MELLKQTDFGWHAQQPDVSKLSAAEMKAFLDAPTHTLMDKVNEVIGKKNDVVGEEGAASLYALSKSVHYLGQQDTAIMEELDGTTALLREDIDQVERKVRELETKEDALQQVQEDVEAICAVQGAQGKMIVSLQEEMDSLYTGLTGQVRIEDLPIGVSYAAERVTLEYLSNAEMNEYGTLPVTSGSCIFKTIGQVTDDSSGETVDGVITVYVIPVGHSVTDEYNNHSTVIMKKITPFHDMYGLQYSLSEIKYNIEVADRISDDPDYAYFHPHHVPSVAAVVDYVSNHAGGGSSEMTELNCWSGSIEDLALGMYYVVDGASIDYYDRNGEWMSTSVSNGATLIVGERMDWNSESGRRKIATVFEPDGYRYLG